MSFQQMKVGAPKSSGLDPLSSNKGFPPFSPKSLRALPAVCAARLGSGVLPGHWEALRSSVHPHFWDFVAVSFSCAPHKVWICHPVFGFLVVFSDGWVTQALE